MSVVSGTFKPPFKFTRAMEFAWLLRPDVRLGKEDTHPDALDSFLCWWLTHGVREYAGWSINSETRAYLTAPINVTVGGVARRLTRIQAAVLKARPDVAAAHDIGTEAGYRSFLDWLGTHGPEEAGLGLLTGEPSRPPQAPMKRRGGNGVTLIGHTKGDFGIAEDLRMAAASATATNLAYTIYHSPASARASQNDDLLAHQMDQDSGYDINLFCVTAFETARLALEHGRRLFHGRYNIGYWPWELATFDQRWHSVFDLVDEIWVSSRYTEEAFSLCAPCPVVYMPMAVSVDRLQFADRRSFNLPSDQLLFLTALDLNSSFARKNPHAALRAFRTAFPTGQDRTTLVVKVMNVKGNGAEWAAFQDLAKDLKEKVIFITESLPRGSMLGLIAACDVLVSLHRAEGFGRILAEAMLLGKPVIATNFSGNVDYLSDSTGYPVNWHPRVVGQGDYPWAEGMMWAEPDIDHAAWCMRQFLSDFADANRRAIQGQALIATRHNPRQVGHRYKARLDAIERRRNEMGTAGWSSKRFWAS